MACPALPFSALPCNLPRTALQCTVLRCIAFPFVGYPVCPRKNSAYPVPLGTQFSRSALLFGVLQVFASVTESIKQLYTVATGLRRARLARGGLTVRPRNVAFKFAGVSETAKVPIKVIPDTEAETEGNARAARACSISLPLRAFAATDSWPAQ